MKTALIAAVLLSAAGSAHAANLITNGDFETGLAGWTSSGQVMTNTAADYQPCCGTIGSEPAYSNNHFVSLGNDDATGLHTLSQGLVTLNTGFYKVTFSAGAFGLGDSLLDVAAGAVSHHYVLPSNEDNDFAFTAFSFLFQATGASTLTFSLTTTEDAVDTIVDNVSVELQGFPAVREPTGGPIPEPGVWALLILGFGAAGARLRRRRSAPA